MKFCGLLLLTIFLSCQSGTQENNQSSVLVSTWNPSFAKGFKINFYNTHNELVLFDLQTQNDTLDVIRIPLNQSPTVALLSTTHVSYLDKLNALDKAKGVSFASFVKNKNAAHLIQKGNILNLTGAEDVDIEKLISLNPDWFFVYPYGHGNYEKYTSKGIPCIPISEYLETHPLGRAEWVFAFAIVMNKWQEAENYFNEVTQEYSRLKSKTDSIPNDRKPCVFSGSDDGGMWFAAPGNSFQGTWIDDAGGNYLFSDSTSTSNIAVPFEQLLSSIYNCDFWGRIDARPQPLTIKDIIQEENRFNQVKAVLKRQVFYCNSNEADYFGDAVVEPEKILGDLIYIFHPDLLPEHQPSYFRILTN